MANNQPLSPQGYNINEDPVNTNPFWKRDTGGGGNVPAGGTAGQFLTKKSATDYDTEWATPDFATTQEVNSAEDRLAADIDAETTARQNADTQLQAAITANSTALSAEQTARQDADAANAAAIQAEQSARAQAISALQTAISALDSAIDGETSARESAVAALQQSITALQNTVNGLDIPDTSDIETAITALQSAVSALEADLAAEETARENADTQLQAAIDAEETARGNAVDELNAAISAQAGDITAEETARQQADTALEAQLDTLAEHDMPTGGTAGQVLKKKTAADYDTEWADESAGLPTPDSAGQVLTAGEDLTPEWQTPQEGHTVPAGGTAGQVLTKKTATDYDVEWKTPETGGGGTNPLPTGGTAGQVLKKKTAADYDVEWADENTGGGGGSLTRAQYQSNLSANVGTAYWNGDSSVTTLYRTFSQFQSDMANVKFCELEISADEEDTYTAFFDPTTLAAAQGMNIQVPFGLGFAFSLRSGATGIGFRARCLEAIKPTTTKQYTVKWFTYS